MLLTSYFVPTIENAPCPPFFVENVYDIFISAAEYNNLTVATTGAIWRKCVEQFPPLSTTTSTTPTTTTTTEKTTSTTPTTTTTEKTTSTTPTTTTTTQQTTSTIPTTTTTTEQTTSTSPTTTTTTEQTTLTTPTTTTTTEQTTSTTPTTTTTTEQTTSTTPTTTTTTEQTTSTTPTTTTTAEQTTSTKLSTTTTKEQTTSTTRKTTTTTEQTTKTTTTTTTEQTKSTTPTTTTTTEQTTSTTPATPTTTEQTTTSTQKSMTTTEQTTSTTPTATTTTEQISSNKPTTTTTTEQTATLTTPITTRNTFSASRTSTPLTFSTSSELTTRVTTSPAPFTPCGTYCRVGAISFSVCLLVGVLAMLFYKAKRKRNFKPKRMSLHKGTDRVKHGKYMQKFPKISRQTDFTFTPLAFENPTLIGHNGFIPGPDTMVSDNYHHRKHVTGTDYKYTQFQDEEHHSYEVYTLPGPLLNHHNVWKDLSSKSTSVVGSYDKPHNKRNRHSSIGSHVPKVLSGFESDYALGVVSYDSNSGLPKIEIDDYGNEIEIKPDYPGSHGLPRIPIEEQSEHPQDDGNIERFHLHTLQGVQNERTTQSASNAGAQHGLPRIPIEQTVDGKQKSSGLPKTERLNIAQKNHIPRTPFENTRDSKIYGVSTKHPQFQKTMLVTPKSRMNSYKMTPDSYQLYNGSGEQNVPHVYNKETLLGSHSITRPFTSYRTPTHVTKL